MKLVIFGLAVSSSWGNGHATLWRGLCKAFGRRGHTVVFFERDVPYYAMHRDLHELPGGTLVLYKDWASARSQVIRELQDADAAMVTSYCPDGIAATELILNSPVETKAFYDLDTPVTLSQIKAGEQLSYLGERKLADFDLVLSYTGGPALTELKTVLGARRVLPLYGSVDPQVHRPVTPIESYRCVLSYLGTYAEDRQRALEELFVEPARLRPEQKFIIGGAQYPAGFPWTNNIHFVQHLPPSEHCAFYCSSRLTLNVTRQAMAVMGYCPSGRLFEAAACGVPILSDWWEGLDQFYMPDREVLVAHSSAEAIAALELSDAELHRIGTAARERTLNEHTADHRARELEYALDTAGQLEELIGSPDFK